MPRTIRPGLIADGTSMAAPSSQAQRDLRAEARQAREDAAGAAEGAGAPEDTQDAPGAILDDSRTHVVHKGGGHYYGTDGQHWRGTHELPDGTVIHETDSERGQAILAALNQGG